MYVDDCCIGLNQSLIISTCRHGFFTMTHTVSGLYIPSILPCTMVHTPHTHTPHTHMHAHTTHHTYTHHTYTHHTHIHMYTHIHTHMHTPHTHTYTHRWLM